MATIKRTQPTGSKAPVKRGTLGNRPRIVIPINAIAEVATGTHFRVVIDRYMKKIKNPKTAIRAKCVECSGGSLKEVQECKVPSCALHPFRMGENPFHLKTIKRLAAESGSDEASEDEDSDE